VAREIGEERRMPDLKSPGNETGLRRRVLHGLGLLETGQTHASEEVFDSFDEEIAGMLDYAYYYLDKQLRPLQIVHFWRVNELGRLIDTAIPVLDTVERCCAYLTGMALLNQHDLRRGIKRCRLAANISPGEAMRNLGVWHWFIDLPNSKQMYCCPKHAAAG
jgi:hypothetical protein